MNRALGGRGLSTYPIRLRRGLLLIAMTVILLLPGEALAIGYSSNMLNGGLHDWPSIYLVFVFGGIFGFPLLYLTFKSYGARWVLFEFMFAGAISAGATTIGLVATGSLHDAFISVPALAWLWVPPSAGLLAARRFGLGQPLPRLGDLVHILDRETQDATSIAQQRLTGKVGVVIRPLHGASPLGGIILAMLGGSAVLALMAYWQGKPDYAYIAGVLVVGSAAIGGYMRLHVRKARIFVTEDQFGRSDWLGRQRLWPRSAVGRVVQGPVSIGGAEDTIGGSHTADSSLVILILGVDGSTLESLSPEQWSESDLRLLWKELGMEPTEGWTEPLRPEKLRKRFPGAVFELPPSSLSPGGYAAVITATLALAIGLSILLWR